MPTTTERGYGHDHQQERERWKPTVEAGQAQCAEPICLIEADGGDRWLDPDQPWHLAHDRTTGGYHGPAHPRCNIAEARRHERGLDTQPTTHRDWPL